MGRWYSAVQAPPLQDAPALQFLTEGNPLVPFRAGLQSPAAGARIRQGFLQSAGGSAPKTLGNLGIPTMLKAILALPERSTGLARERQRPAGHPRRAAMDPALPAGVGAVPGPVRAGAPGRPARTGHRTADLGPPEAHRHHAHAGGRGHRLHAVDPASRAAPAHRLPVPVPRGRGRNTAGRPSAGGLHADPVRGHHLAAGRGCRCCPGCTGSAGRGSRPMASPAKRARDAEHGRARHPHRGRAHRRTVRPAQHSGRGAVQHSRQPDLAAEPLCHRRADLGAELAALVLRHTRLPRAGADHGRAGPGRLPERRHQRRRLRRRVRAEQQPDGRVHLHRRRRRDAVAGRFHPVVLARNRCACWPSPASRPRC